MRFTGLAASFRTAIDEYLQNFLAAWAISRAGKFVSPSGRHARPLPCQPVFHMEKQRIQPKAAETAAKTWINLSELILPNVNLVSWFA
jgi:hypothetical protein